MHEEQTEREEALAEVRWRLADGLARTGLTKTQLAQRAGLGRTTVQQAFQKDAPVPSAVTVAVLARALCLPVEELLALQRTATGKDDPATASGMADQGPGRPITEWDPHDLEVHPAGTAPGPAPMPGRASQRVLPGYVPRNHDQALAEAVRDAAQGRSRMLILVGTSSTGKTRACWEAVQPLAGAGWRLWHPFDPTRAHAALEQLQRVRPRTVVWLNEAQHYLGDTAVGEQIAAAVHALLTDPGRAPVLVLGTLWPEYADRYTALPTPGRPDPHSRTRELLAGRTLTIPNTFDQEALRAAAALAADGDELLADALTRTRDHGRLAQDLAGAPELLRRYHHSTPAARTVLEAAMDARRLGVGLHLPQTFLIDAAADYLTDHDYDHLTDDWAEQAFADLAHLVHGRQACLRRVNPRPARRQPGSPTPNQDAVPTPVFRLADYLEQHGRTTRRHLCPPASFWHAAHTHLTHPDDLHNLAEAAEARHRLQWAHHLRHRAADAGHPKALVDLIWVRGRTEGLEKAEQLYRAGADAGHPDALISLAGIQEKAGNFEKAEQLYRAAADSGYPGALVHVAGMAEEVGDFEKAEQLYRSAVDAGVTYALAYLVGMREVTGHREEAEKIAQQAANNGHPDALIHLAQLRKEAGDRREAERLAQKAASNGHPDALAYLARMQQETSHQEKTGDRQKVERLYRAAADNGNIYALAQLMQMREKAGDREEAERLAQKAANNGHPGALTSLAGMREGTGDRKKAEQLYYTAAEAGYSRALISLAQMREKIGDQEEAERLYRAAADNGHLDALGHLAQMREKAGDRQQAERLAQQAANNGHPDALRHLAQMREKTGDQEEAERLYRAAADNGDLEALVHLAELGEDAGDRQEAERLYRAAADNGDSPWGRSLRLLFESRWPYGLDPDGTPTPPWQ